MLPICKVLKTVGNLNNQESNRKQYQEAKKKGKQSQIQGSLQYFRHSWMDNRSEKTISRAIFGSSFDFHLIYEPIEPCQPRIFDFRFSPLSFRPETNTLLLPDHQRMDNRSENPIRRSIIDLSPDSPFIYEPIEPCHPLIFWCSLLSALLSSRNKFILPGPPISRPPEPRKVHRKLH